MAEPAPDRAVRLEPPLFRFCPRCGAHASAGDRGRCFDCVTCGFLYFHNTASATAALVVWQGRLLATRRAHAPGAGLLDLPGGFVDPGERAETALARELAEELGWATLPAVPCYLCSAPNRYPYAGVEYATCDAFFVLDVVGERPAIAANTEIAGHEWLVLTTVDPADFAFASVRAALDCLQRLRAG
ncbi:MAG: NUDIX domain-containing protein [Gammaproteobacteria bacterium]